MQAPHHDCNQVMSRMLLAIDGELSKEEEALLMRDLQSCNCCNDHFQIEKAFKEFMSNRLQRKCCCSDMAEKIKSNIKEKLFKP